MQKEIEEINREQDRAVRLSALRSKLLHQFKADANVKDLCCAVRDSWATDESGRRTDTVDFLMIFRVEENDERTHSEFRTLALRTLEKLKLKVGIVWKPMNHEHRWFVHGSVSPEGPAGSAPTLQQGGAKDAPRPPIGLLEASAFDAKLRRFCRLKDLELKYQGTLGWRWRAGRILVLERYNAWYVRALYERRPDGALGDRLFPMSVSEETIRSGEQVGVRIVFDFRLGRFPSAPNVVSVKLGSGTVDVLVEGIEGDRSIDQEVPILGMSVRRFLKRVEVPHEFDETFGVSALSAQPSTRGSPESGERNQQRQDRTRQETRGHL